MKRIGLFFGGIGNEAEVSVVSARSVAANFDHKKYELVLMYWHRDGHFYQVKNFSEIKNPKKVVRGESFHKVFDVALPMTHGRYGEDGVLQGIFERFGVRYCGCKLLSSALCMDKAVAKTYLSGHGVRQTKFAVIDYSMSAAKEAEKELEKIAKGFSLPLFVKPSNSGSSVGITKVEKVEDLEKAVKKARRHDKKIVVEEGLVAPREIEVGVLGNGVLTMSRPGELVLTKDFYDYDEKYKRGRTETRIPAKLTLRQEKEITEMAEKAYKLCGCRGFARIDFFLAGGKVYLNEINTLPGFTGFSMYPLLMMDTGLSYPGLINKIISLA